MKGQAWNGWEDLILLNNPDKGPKELQTTLPLRTIPALKSRKNKLNLSRKDKTWNDEEDQILQDNPKMSVGQLKMLLPGRSDTAIRQRRCKLGLRYYETTSPLKRIIEHQKKLKEEKVI